MKKSLIWTAVSTAIAFCNAAISAEPSFPAGAPPRRTPNVLIVMTDDVGFAASTAFGGEIPTPTFNALANDGLKYNNFFTTALCSPSRAALLTGRNHHSVGFGTVPELATPQEGYTTLIPKTASTVAQILLASGYDTAMFGKNHNVPTWHGGPLGPFSQWASGLGFGYFYGFNGGWTNQFYPALIENTRAVDPPGVADGTEHGYILERDLADHAITWLRTQHSEHPSTPFLLYYASGSAHAPLQAPAEWIAKFKGKFDAGWDVYRAATLARQKRFGVAPTNAQLAALPEGIRPWEQLSPNERAVAARFMETYAAQLSYCDYQVGRIIAELKSSGRYDNTLVIFIEGDNGASGEGGETGAFNYATRMTGGYTIAQETSHSLSHIDEIGGPRSYAVGPIGWAAAMNTPFPYYKMVASRLGGTRTGMVISWPAGIHARGVRRQFVDITDITPTILDAVGVKPPAAVDGTSPTPLDGASFADTFSSVDAPSHHHTQYFEVFGHAAIYHDGWLLAERTRTDPVRRAAMPDTVSPWQLYDLNHDFSQTTDIATGHPDKVAEMTSLWQAEAARNHVLPLVASNLPAKLPGTRPELVNESGRYTFFSSSDRYPNGAFPQLHNRDWTIEADIEVPPSGAAGVLATQGGRDSGWALVALHGAPTFLYRLDDRDDTLTRLASDHVLADGHHSIKVTFNVDGPGIGRGGNITLRVDGTEAAVGRLEHTAPFTFGGGDATIGRETSTAVSDDYKPPYTFNGTVDAVTFDIGPVQLPK